MELANSEEEHRNVLRCRRRKPASLTRVATVLIYTTAALNLTACTAFSSCAPCSLSRSRPLLKAAAVQQQRHTARTACVMKVLSPQTAGDGSSGRSVAISTVQAALDAAEKRDWKRSLTLFHLSLTTGRKPKVSCKQTLTHRRVCSARLLTAFYIFINCYSAAVAADTRLQQAAARAWRWRQTSRCS